MIKKTVVALLFSGFALGNTSAQVPVSGEFTLPSLIGKAIDYHPSVKSNLFLENSAKEGVTSAKWQYFPTPKFAVSQANTSSTDSNYNGDERVSVLSLTQPLWAGGYIDAGLNKARAELLSARATTKVTQQELALRVISAYSQWYKSYLEKESYKKSQEEHSVLRDRLKRRITQGLSSSSDLSLANSRLSQAEAGLNSAIIQHKDSLFRLEKLLGIALNPEYLIKDFHIVKFKDGQDGLNKRALQMSPKIKQTKAESLVIKAEIKQSYAKMYPGINLKLERQWGNFTTKDAETENRIFIEFNSAFSAGLSNASQTKGIESRYQATQAQMEDEKNQITQRINLDWMSSISLKKQRILLESSLENTEKVRKSYYRQFLAGRKTWQEVMNSIREVSQLETQLAGVYGEMILSNWRIFVYVEDVAILATLSDEVPAFNRTDKILWHPTVGVKKAQNSVDKILNFITPDEQSVEKIIWHSDIDNFQNNFKSFLKERSFLEFIERLDKETIQSESK